MGLEYLQRASCSSKQIAAARWRYWQNFQALPNSPVLVLMRRQQIVHVAVGISILSGLLTSPSFELPIMELMILLVRRVFELGLSLEALCEFTEETKGSRKAGGMFD